MFSVLYKIFLYLLFFIIFNNAKSLDYLDYPLSFIVDSCQITKQRISLEKDEKKVLEGRKKYNTCMNFVLALSSTLNRRCIAKIEKKISPESALTFADLSMCIQLWT